MTQKDKEAIEHEQKPTNAEEVEHDDGSPKLSKRAQEALKSSNPLTESLLAKVLGNQVTY